jgi:hypothetical protein
MSEKLETAWYDLVARDEWAYFGTATFKNELSTSTAERKFSSFLADVTTILGAAPRCIHVTEGGETKRPHVHFLLGGVAYKVALRRQLQALWNKRCGILHLVRFDDSKREAAIHYILKTVRSGKSDNVNLTGPGKAAASLTKPTTTSISAAAPARKARCDAGTCGSPKANSSPQRSARLHTAADDKPTGSKETVRLPSIMVKKDADFHVQLEGNHLIIVLRLTKPRPSKSGKTNVVGSTRGARATLAQLGGLPILVNANAMVKPTSPGWRLRSYAETARLEGRLN